MTNARSSPARRRASKSASVSWPTAGSLGPPLCAWRTRRMGGGAAHPPGGGSRSAGGDALTAGRAGNGDAAHAGQRTIRADAELIDDAVPAGLYVQELAAGRRGGVHGARVSGGLAEQRELAAGAGGVAADVRAARVGR